MAAIVQQITGAVSPDYGIATGTIATAEYNSLVAFASWNVAGVGGTSVNIPAVNVTDSAGNCWRQIGISTAFTPGGVRCAIWATLNAQPVTWVSVALTGWGAATAYTVAEISGLPQALALDFAVSNNGTAGSGTAISVTGIASGADIGFAVLGTDLNPAVGSVTVPSGWSALATAATALGAAGTAVTRAYWNTGVTAGTASPAWIFSNGAVFNQGVVYCGISASASPPQQENRNFPLITTEAAFGATPGDIRASVDYTFDNNYASWQDISSRVIGADIGGRISDSRGREYELQQEESGELTVHLNNVDGAFIPGNSASPYYSSALNGNMSFETGAAGWTASNGAITASTVYAFSGTQSAQLIPSGGTVQAYISSAVMTVNPNYPLSASAQLYTPNPVFYDSLIPVSSPSGWWKLADATGSRVAADSSGNLHNAVAGTNVTFGYSSLAVTGDTSTLFGGSATSAGLLTNWKPVLTPVTVEAWVNRLGTAQTGSPRIICAGHTDADFTGFELYLNGGTQPRLVFGNGATAVTVSSSGTVPNAGWTYLTGTWNGTTATLYQNGVSVGTGTLSGTMATPAAPVSIGYDAAYNGDYFHGAIAQCALYPAVLAATAITAHYAAGPLNAAVNIDWYNASSTYLSSTSGTAIQIPAGTWTQTVNLGGSAPAGAAGARISVILGGTPSTSDILYIDEAALVYGTAAVATGLVALEVPARATAWWNGRQYPLWCGYVERWPLRWQELPQWGFAEMKATDAIAVASIGEMLSALDGEVLIDSPYAYLTCKEQYTDAFTGATTAQPFLFGASPYYAPADANGLIAINKAPENQVTGTYGDGLGGQISTGLDISFMGDSGTGMGTDSYGSATAGVQGPRMTYTDPGMAAVTFIPSQGGPGGFCTEHWFVYGGTAGSCDLLGLYGGPSAFLATEAVGLGSQPMNGNFIQIMAEGTDLWDVTNYGTDVLNGYISNGGSAPQHVVINWNNDFPRIYVNGVENGIPTAASGSGLEAVVLGAGRYAYDLDNATPLLYGVQNYVAGHLAVYPYQLSPQRIVSHYNTGLNGAAGLTAAQVFAQILTWAGFGLKRGGFLWSSATGNPEVTQIGPAYNLEGASAASNLYALQQSEGGLMNVQANGSLIYLERWATYNVPVSDYLGDNATSDSAPLNANSSFAGNVSSYSAQNGTISFAASPAYGPGAVGSCLLSPAGTATVASVNSTRFPVSGGGTYTAGAWIYSPAGYSSIFIGFDWYSGATFLSSTSSTFRVASASWSYFEAGDGAPLTATQAVLRVGESGSPGTANTLNIAWAAAILRSTEIPALGDAEFDYDNTYIYNEAIVTQEDGPNQLFTVDDRDIPSQNALFRRTALNITANVVSAYDVADNATWQLAAFGEPELHVAAITIDVASNPSVFKRVLSLDIGDVVTYTRRPLGSQPLTTSGMIQRISHDIGPGYFRVKLQVSPGGPAQNVLAADVPGFDTPASTELGW
jgi:Concanavalin A-like lectin/glucanases superfamily